MWDGENGTERVTPEFAGTTTEKEGEMTQSSIPVVKHLGLALQLTFECYNKGAGEQRTDTGLREKVQPSLSQDLGADQRCDCIHGGGDERDELLRVLPVGLAAVLR